MSSDLPPEWMRSQADIDRDVSAVDQARAYVDAELGKVCAAFVAHRGDYEKAAEDLGLGVPEVSRRITRALVTAAKKGWSEAGDVSPHVPSGFQVKGTSTLIGTDPETGERNVKLTWVKTERDKAQQLDAMREACESLLAPYKGQSRVVPAPRPTDDDLMVVMPWGDPHVGLYSWPVETGQAFDLDICTANIRSAARQSIDVSPPAKTAVMALMGDNQHADTSANRTLRSNHVLDVDSRYGKVAKANVYIWREVIYMMLDKFEHVKVVVVIGNHDDHSALWLRLCLEAFFDKDPRVEVMGEGGERFHYLEFGRNLLGFHHGDTCKIGQLAGVMSADLAAEWGRTRFRHWYTGHIHSKTFHEMAGCTAETIRTIAARDAYAHFAGYRSDRTARVDVWHRNRGPLTSHTIGIEQIEEHA